MDKPTSSSESFQPSSRRSVRWVWGAPYLAVVVFAMVMLGLVWMLQTQEIQNQRNAVARDVQWAEQTIRLHTRGTEEFLVQMARDIASGALDRDGFQVRANQYIANNPELVNIVWVDVGQVVRWSAPFDSTDWLAGEHLTTLQEVPFYAAREKGGAVYGEAYSPPRGAAVLEMFVPVRHGRAFLGTVVAVYSIDAMVRHMVPNWFAGKYRVALLDGADKILAVNTAIRDVDESVGYALALDPPGNGLTLRATAFRVRGELPRGLPAAIIVGLSVLMLWSLWLMRRHQRSRVRVEKERDRLFSLSLDILCIIGLDGVFKRCNPAFAQVLGYRAEEMPGRSLLTMVHAEDVSEAVEHLRSLAAGKPSSFEIRCRCASGGYKWLAWSVNPAREERLLYAVAHDITGRKAGEEALRVEYSFRKAMEESVVTGLRAIDLKGRIIYVNPAFCRMVGFPQEELVGVVAPFPYWPSEEMETCQRYLDLTLSGQAPPGGFELRIRRKSGERIDARFYLSPLIDSGGVQTGWMASITDITEPKRVRAELEAAHQRFEAVLDGVEAAVFVADARSDEILFANRAFKAIHGFDAVGRTVRGMAVPQPERGDYRIDPRNLQPTEVPRELFDGELQHPYSGRWYHVREQATRWVDGRVVRMGVATDITDRKQMEQVAREQEERLARTSRLITMGEMASTLAHELNQPLAAIANYSMGCATRLETGNYRREELLAAMRKAGAQAERAGHIIRRIRDFVRKSEPRRAPVSLAEVMEDALGIAELNSRKAGVELVVDVPAGLPLVSADRIMVEQVVLNLIRNGVEAMAGTRPSERVLNVAVRPVAGRMMQVSVADHGHGIGQEDLEHLFKPFFSTKAEGMGMGLNICRSIIEFHGGRLWVEPNPVGGTIFHFTIPMETAREHLAEQS